MNKNWRTLHVLREIDISALLALREREIPVVLGKSCFDFVPFRVVRWIFRRTGEVRKWRLLHEGGPVASGMNIVPAEAGEE